MNGLRACAVLAVLVVLVTASLSFGAGGPSPADASTISVEGKTYDTLLTMPEHEPIALAVLFSGGLAADLHWTVPATVEVDGKAIPLTTGGDTRDADAIGAALLARDIAVFQYSSIPREQPDPATGAPVPYPASREIACAALADATSRPRLAGVPVICIGHSLGAARAVQCARDDASIAGFVLLSGAYLSNPRENPSVIEQPVVDAMRAMGADLDAGVNAETWAESNAAAPEAMRALPFVAIDVDADGSIHRWEMASALHVAMLRGGDRSFEREKQDLGGEVLPGKILVDARTPTLVIYGSLDPMAYHGPMLAREANAGGDGAWLTIEYRRDLGHNLGPVEKRTDGFAEIAGPVLTGPIDPGVCGRIADFAADAASR